MEFQGEASKTAICDHVRDLHGTTGDCVARRMREMVAAGVLLKEPKEYEGKKYFSYRIKPYAEPTESLGKNCPCCGTLLGSEHLDWCGDWDVKAELDKLINPSQEKLI